MDGWMDIRLILLVTLPGARSGRPDGGLEICGRLLIDKGLGVVSLYLP